MVPQPRGRSQRQLNTQGLSGVVLRLKGTWLHFHFAKMAPAFQRTDCIGEAGVDGRSQMADCWGVRVQMMVAGPGRSHLLRSRVETKG